MIITKKLIFFICILLISLNLSAQSYSINIANPKSIYAKQKKSNWCWAACNQMLLKSVGVSEAQEDQVEKLFGDQRNEGAGTTYKKAKTALAGDYTDENGDEVTVIPYVSYLKESKSNDPKIIIGQLENDIPLIMATSQHGRVCIGVDYVKNGSFYKITRLRLLDPMRPGEILTYTMQQFINEGLIGFMTINVD